MLGDLGVPDSSPDAGGVSQSAMGRVTRVARAEHHDPRWGTIAACIDCNNPTLYPLRRCQRCYLAAIFRDILKSASEQ